MSVNMSNMFLYVLLTTFIVSKLASAQVSLIIREASMDLVWWDKGSGAARDVSTYAPSNCLRLGDSAAPHYDLNRKPRGFCVEEVLPGSLAVPTRMNKVWDDAGSGANWDGSFWSFDCPPGFVALGHATSRSHNAPTLANYRCVKQEFVTQGEPIGYIWDDRGSGARRDVSVFGLNCPAASEFSGLIISFGYYNVPSTRRACLSRSVYRIDYGAPVSRVEIRDVRYDLNRKVPRGANPPIAIVAGAENCPQSGLLQTPKLTFTRSYEETSSWSTELVVTAGVSVSVSAKAPLTDTGSEVTVSTSVSYGQTNTASRTVTRTYSAEVPINIPAGFKITATASLQIGKFDVPYVATAIYYRTDGSQSTGTVSGVYNGVEIGTATFAYGPLISC